MELGNDPIAPPLFIAEWLTGLDGFQLLDQLLAIDQEGFANLIAAEAVQQLDGLPAFDAEEFFDRGAVEDGYFKQANLLEDPGNTKQPLGLGRHVELSLPSQRYHTVVRNPSSPVLK